MVAYLPRHLLSILILCAFESFRSRFVRDGKVKKKIVAPLQLKAKGLFSYILLEFCQAHVAVEAGTGNENDRNA
jgi:hypothetical protein